MMPLEKSKREHKEGEPANARKSKAPRVSVDATYIEITDDGDTLERPLSAHDSSRETEQVIDLSD